MTERGGIQFFKPPDLTAAGGLCAPITTAYALPTTNERPIRDAFVEMFRIAEMDDLERHVYLLGKNRSVTWGREDVSARVAESRRDDDWDDEDEFQGVRGHEWDARIKLSWSGIYEFESRFRG